MSDPYGTVPMFPVPEVYKRPAKEIDPETVIWKTYKGARLKCHDCISNIREGGYRYLAEPAVLARTQGGHTVYYCGVHGQRRRVVDDLA